MALPYYFIEIKIQKNPQNFNTIRLYFFELFKLFEGEKAPILRRKMP